MPEEIEPPESYGAPYMPDRAESILGSFDWTDVIEEIQHRLKREKLVEREGVKVWERNREKGVKPLLNSIGIEDILVLITAYCQRITALSNIDEKEQKRIYVILKQVGSRLISILAKNYTAYAIQYPSHIILIYETVMGPLEFALRQPLDQGGRIFVWKSMGERREIITREGEER